MKTLILTVLMAFTTCVHSQMFFHFKIYTVTKDLKNLTPAKVKKNSDSKTTITRENKDTMALEFFKFLNGSAKTKIDASKATNFKYKCVFRYNLFSRRTIYFTERGDYYYRGEYYQKDKLFDFVYKCVNDTKFGVL